MSILQNCDSITQSLHLTVNNTQMVPTFPAVVLRLPLDPGHGMRRWVVITTNPVCFGCGWEQSVAVGTAEQRNTRHGWEHRNTPGITQLCKILLLSHITDIRERIRTPLITYVLRSNLPNSLYIACHVYVTSAV